MDDINELLGTEGTPNPEVQQPADQGSTQEAALIALQKKIDSLQQVVSGLQSDKDKRVNQLQKQVGELEARYTRYQELRSAGLTAEAAERQLTIDDMLAEYQAQKQSGSGRAVNPGQPTGNRTLDEGAEAILNEFQIDVNDPDVVQLIAENKATPAEITRLVVRRSATPAPKSGQMAASPGGQPPKEDLQAAYVNELKEARTAAERIELRRKYRNKGLNI